MEIGIMWQLRNPPAFERPPADLYRDVLDEIVFAEELGVESAWVTEHHFCVDGYLPSVMPTLAAIAARTSKIRIGPYVLLAPLYHPLRLAEDAAVVDILSGGRLEMAIGSGYKADEFVGMGVDRHTRGRRTDEIVAIMLQAWSDGSVNFNGSIFSIEGVEVTPKPVQRPIPIYLGGVSRPVLERIARLGVTGVAGPPNPQDMEYFHEKLRAYERDPQTVDYLKFQFMWVDRDHERAQRVARPYAEWVLGQYRNWLIEVDERNFKGTRYDVLEDHCIMGNPEYCIEQLEARLAIDAHAPGRRFVILPPLLGCDHFESMRMIETLATEVNPHFRDDPIHNSTRP